MRKRVLELAVAASVALAVAAALSPLLWKAVNVVYAVVLRPAFAGQLPRTP